MQETLIIYTYSNYTEETYLQKYEHKKLFSKKTTINEEQYKKYLETKVFLIRYPNDNEEEIVYEKISYRIKCPEPNENDPNKEIIEAFFPNKDKLLTDELIDTKPCSYIPSRSDLEYDKILVNFGYAAKLQSIINKLQSEGYNVDIKSLALFMDKRLDRLIMMRTVKEVPINKTILQEKDQTMYKDKRVKDSEHEIKKHGGILCSLKFWNTVIKKLTKMTSGKKSVTKSN
jgi:hypothetical protein